MMARLRALYARCVVERRVMEPASNILYTLDGVSVTSKAVALLLPVEPGKAASTSCLVASN